MLDPIVIDPPGFDQKAGWKECREWSDNHEGFAAAAGADPGICSCPACGEMYWAWGRIQKCVKCDFEYPTDAWAMFSWGTQAKWRQANTKIDPEFRARLDKHDRDRLWHPYFCYGFECGPDKLVGDLFTFFTAQDWRTIMASFDGHKKYQKPEPRKPSPEVLELLAKAGKARAAIVEHLGGPWKKGTPSAVGKIDCPVCGGKETLAFRRAGYNGHIHAQCSTDGCVSWME